MKKLYAVFLLLSFVSCSSNKLQYSPMNYEKFKGAVSVEESCYLAEKKFGEIVPGKYISTTKTEFDPDGNVLHRIFESSDEYYYTYKNGMWSTISYKGCRTDANYVETVLERKKNYLKYEKLRGVDITIYEVFYDKLSEKGYSEGGVLEWENSYDKNGLLLEHRDYNEKGEISHRTVYEYDDKNLLVKYTSYWERFNYIETYSYNDFDKKGNWTTMIEYNEDEDAKRITKREIIYR